MYISRNVIVYSLSRFVLGRSIHGRCWSVGIFSPLQATDSNESVIWSSFAETVNSWRRFYYLHYCVEFAFYRLWVLISVCFFRSVCVFKLPLWCSKNE